MPTVISATFQTGVRDWGSPFQNRCEDLSAALLTTAHTAASAAPPLPRPPPLLIPR